MTNIENIFEKIDSYGELIYEKSLQLITRKEELRKLQVEHNLEIDFKSLGFLTKGEKIDYIYEIDGQCKSLIREIQEITYDIEKYKRKIDLLTLQANYLISK